jgi:serpin B
MNRRDALLGLALAPALLSCTREALAARANIAAGKAADGKAPDPALISAAQQRLSWRVIQALSKDGGTVVVSPASIAAAFSTISAGASGDLVQAISGVLGFAAPIEAPAALAAVADALDRAQDQVGGLSMARALVLDPSLKPSDSTRSALQAANVEMINETFDKQETLTRINDWVAAKTKGNIPTLLDEVPRQTGLVALDALHFKDQWKRQFDAALTSARPFHLTGGHERTVPMMVSPEGSWRFRKDEQFIAVDLPYQSDRFSLTVITGRAEPLSASRFDEIVSWLDGDGFEELNGQVQLPKFALSASHELLGVFDAMGLAPSRFQQHALSGFSEQELAISKVVQRVKLGIDEDGTEAAAATGIVTSRSVASADYVQMIVDRPFIFSLRDAKSGLILLSGYVAEVAVGT